MIFRDPWLLLFLPVFLLLIFWRRKEKKHAFLFPTDTVIQELRTSFKLYIYRNILYLNMLCVCLMIVALARPQVSTVEKSKKEGIAIIIAVDCSSTMLAEDLKPDLKDIVRLQKLPGNPKTINRVDAVRDVAKEFISSRPDDLIGLIAFAAEAFVLCPPTFDRDWLLRSLDRIKVGLIKDGTAIGSGILSSLKTLEDINAKSKIIILLTDGINNFGQMSVQTAAEAARAIGVRIYTIGVVSEGRVKYPVTDEYGRTEYKEVAINIDETALKNIANITGGTYFRAEDMEALRGSYKEIDRLERVEIEETGYEEYADIFEYFLFPAFALFFISALLSNTYLRKIP